MPVRIVLVFSFVLVCNATPVVKDDPITINDVDPEKSNRDPSSAMTGVYTNCLARLSFPCIQQKTLIFIDRLSRMERIKIIGDVLTIVKINGEDQFKPHLSEDILTARQITDEATLRALIDLSIDRFFQTHVIRLQLPELFSDSETQRDQSSASDTSIDFTIGETIQAEGRKKGGGGGGGGGKMKGMKKLMMLMGMMMMTKLMMLAPLLMGVVGLAAIKALIFSVASITISKIMILKKLKAMMGQKGGGHGGGHDSGHGGGGGGGWSSSGSGGSSGGWDRSFDDTGHLLAYRGYAS